MLSARDLVRQIPAEWQENVKHRRNVGYRAFLDKITDPSRAGELASWFWGVQEVPDILDRWGSSLPPERVHLVTVPKPGAPRDLLWQRFSAVLGLDEAVLELATDRANPSLGVPETALVRRINAEVNNGVLANEDYREYVRELLAHRTLSQRSGSPRLGLPPDVRSWAVDLSESWIEELAKQGYDVVGSLDELRPDDVDQPFADPDEPVEADVADAAVQSIVTLLEEVVRREEVERHAAPRPRLGAGRARPGPRPVVPGQAAAGQHRRRQPRSRRPAWPPTGGCGAAAPGRRSDRSARWSRRPRPRRPGRRPPGHGARPSWRSACRPPW